MESDIDREARLRMVKEQLAERGIRDARVLEAMRMIPRHLFVPEEYRYRAYADGPLPIGDSQTISQPYIVALMTQLLGLKGHERVLEIGTGSGYQAAVLGRLAKEVFSVERYERLAKAARAALKEIGSSNVHVVVGDGSSGLPDYSPYDAILITAAAPRIPRLLVDQLAEGGRLVGPVGGVSGQVLELLVRKQARIVKKKLVPVAFVPLRGEFGWQDDEW